jgi:hypothetical protein
MFLKNHPSAGKKTKKSLMKIAEESHGNLHRALEQLKGTTFTYSQTGTQNLLVAKMRQDMFDDPWMMPLRYHENLPKLLKQKNKMVAYQQVLPYFCLWDQIMNHRDVESEVGIDILAQALGTYIPVSVKEDDYLTDFTKMLSNLSLQKKHERFMYPSWDHGFIWSHAQIFCEYSKQKWKT